MKKIYILWALCLIMAACASNKTADEDLSAEELYNRAYENLEATKYKKAAEEFERLETEHPYSQWAVKAKLMGAYAYYKDEKYDDAIMAADRFIKYHPGNKDAAYAYYLKGMSYYDQISAADKDQGNTQMAEETFRRLIALYPDSKYAEDVKQRINLAEDYKAGQEMIIGRFYLHEKNYLSALNRFNVVLEEYQTTVQIEEALYRQVEIYAIFGMNNYAEGYYKILKQNYPEGKWTQKAARIMEKISKNTLKKSAATSSLKADLPIAEVKEPEVAAKAEVEAAGEAEKGGWLSWFKSAKKEEPAEVKEPEAVAKAETAGEAEKGGWLSWFKSTKKEEPAVVEEPEAVAKAEAKDEKGGWLSWFKSAKKEEPAVVEEPEAVAKAETKAEKSGWLSWFKSAKKEEPTEVKESETETKEDTLLAKLGWFKNAEVQVSSVQPSSKENVGDVTQGD